MTSHACISNTAAQFMVCLKLPPLSLPAPPWPSSCMSRTQRFCSVNADFGLYHIYAQEPTHANLPSDLKHLSNQAEAHSTIMPSKAQRATCPAGLSKAGKKLRQSLWRRLRRHLTPPADKLYMPWCTFVVVLAVVGIFFFMAGAELSSLCRA